MDRKKLIIITGPTAVGKTALSIKLANNYHCPIISFDSRQFYEEMNIGTAKPNLEELSQAEHHFIGNLSIEERYTAGIFEKEALELLSEIFAKNDYCVAVGGSGLYIDALAFGIDDIPSDENIREALKLRWQSEGLDVLQEELRLIDPDFYEIGDMKNSRRVIRALEAYQITGKTYTELRKKTPKKRSFDTYWIGLNMERQSLFDRINLRVDQMIEHGLENEAKMLFPKKHHKALRTVGYSEFFSFFEGEITKERAIELVKRNTRQYAKRQITWFKKNDLIKWFEPEDGNEIIKEINRNFLQ